MNDAELRLIFRLLMFLDANDQPAERWAQCRHDDQDVLKAAVRECYADLFTLYPAAGSKPDYELSTWFRPPVTRQ